MGIAQKRLSCRSTDEKLGQEGSKQKSLPSTILMIKFAEGYFALIECVWKWKIVELFFYIYTAGFFFRKLVKRIAQLPGIKFSL
jgi:hypothetical protein